LILFRHFDPGATVVVERQAKSGHVYTVTDWLLFQQLRRFSTGQRRLETLRRLTVEGKVLAVFNGTRAVVLEWRDRAYRVRIEDGHNAGVEGWIEARFLRVRQ
jgi:hypothetical protein